MKRLMLLIAILGICFLIFPQIANASATQGTAAVEDGNVRWTDTGTDKITGGGTDYFFNHNNGTYYRTRTWNYGTGQWDYSGQTVQFQNLSGTPMPKWDVAVGWTVVAPTYSSTVQTVEAVVNAYASISGTFNGNPLDGVIVFTNPVPGGSNDVTVDIAGFYSGMGTYDFSTDQFAFNGDLYQGPMESDAGPFAITPAPTGMYTAASGSSFSLTGLEENVPEPATIFGGAAAIFGIAWRKRKVFRKR